MINEMIDGIPKMVAGLEPWIFLLSIQLGIVIPTDELIFFRGVGQPPTSAFVQHVSEVFGHGGLSLSGRTVGGGVEISAWPYDMYMSNNY